MADTLWILCSGAQAFLLYCLFDSAPATKQCFPRRFDEELWKEPQKSNIVPLQFIGPTSIALWNDGTWVASFQM
jgi:hypothetical protein